MLFIHVYIYYVLDSFTWFLSQSCSVTWTCKQECMWKLMYTHTVELECKCYAKNVCMHVDPNNHGLHCSKDGSMLCVDNPWIAQCLCNLWIAQLVALHNTWFAIGRPRLTMLWPHVLSTHGLQDCSNFVHVDRQAFEQCLTTLKQWEQARGFDEVKERRP